MEELPKPDFIREGFTFDWYFYKNEADALKCSSIARKNKKEGICCPGEIYGPNDPINSRPGFWHVTVRK